MEQATEGEVAAAELLMEVEDEEEDWRGSFMASRLPPLQAPVPEKGRPIGLKFWHEGQDVQVGRWGPPTSARAQGKAPTVEPLPLEMDEELVRPLQ